MKTFFVRAGIPEEDILFYPHGENGEGETDACLEKVRQLYGKDFSFVPIISWFYAPRMRLILSRRGIRPNRWIITHGGVRIADVLWEFVKFPKTIFFLALSEHKGSRAVVPSFINPAHRMG